MRNSKSIVDRERREVSRGVMGKMRGESRQIAWDSNLLKMSIVSWGWFVIVFPKGERMCEKKGEKEKNTRGRWSLKEWI